MIIKIDKKLSPAQKLWVALHGRPQKGDIPDVAPERMMILESYVFNGVSNYDEKKKTIFKQYFGFQEIDEDVSVQEVDEVINELLDRAKHPFYQDWLKAIYELDNETLFAQLANIFDAKQNLIRVCEEVASRSNYFISVIIDKKNIDIKKSKSLMLSDLHLKSNVYLAILGIFKTDTTVEDFLKLTDEEILAISGIGAKSYAEIDDRIKSIGLSIKKAKKSKKDN